MRIAKLTSIFAAISLSANAPSRILAEEGPSGAALAEACQIAAQQAHASMKGAGLVGTLTVNISGNGGATAVAVAASLVANPIAYTQLVEKERVAVDSADAFPNYNLTG